MKLRYGIAGAALLVALAAGGIATAIGGDDSVDADPTGVTFEDDDFVGLSLPEAITKAEDEGRPWRIARQDDEGFVLTGDLVAGRVTFEVDDDTITNADIEVANLAGPGDVAPEDPARAELVAAAVERLVTVDNSFGGTDVFDDFRIARVIASDPNRPLEALDRELIADALSDLGEVRFIDDADTEIEKLFADSPAGVAVVSVEDVLLLDDRAEVELRLWCGSLCGVFLTYEAVPDAAGWDIVGTMGPVAVS